MARVTALRQEREELTVMRVNPLKYSMYRAENATLTEASMAQPSCIFQKDRSLSMRAEPILVTMTGFQSDATGLNRSMVMRTALMALRFTRSISERYQPLPLWMLTLISTTLLITASRMTLITMMS